MAGKVFAALVGGAVLIAAGTSAAHHSSGVFFDNANPITLTGTLTSVDWRNPHIRFVVEVKREGAEAESWVVQSAPPNIMKSINISKASFESAIGQRVTVVIRPARDGSPSGQLGRITLPDGTRLGS